MQSGVSLDFLLQFYIVKFQVRNGLVILFSLLFDTVEGVLCQIALFLDILLKAAFVEAMDATLSLVALQVD